MLRYHQTNLGGSIHSDGPQHTTPPKYIIMACEQNSLSGGDTVLVDAKKIYEYLKNKKPKIFKILKQKILFERRGFKFNNGNVFLQRIFDVKKNNFLFRYLRDYIEKGYELKKKKLPIAFTKAFDKLDSLLTNRKFMKKLSLKEEI